MVSDILAILHIYSNKQTLSQSDSNLPQQCQKQVPLVAHTQLHNRNNFDQCSTLTFQMAQMLKTLSLVILLPTYLTAQENTWTQHLPTTLFPLTHTPVLWQIYFPSIICCHLYRHVYVTIYIYVYNFIFLPFVYINLSASIQMNIWIRILSFFCFPTFYSFSIFKQLEYCVVTCP